MKDVGWLIYRWGCEGEALDLLEGDLVYLFRLEYDILN